GDASGGIDPRRSADRRGGEALHGSGERRAQRGQHSDQHAAAGDFAPDPGTSGGTAETRADSCHDRRRGGVCVSVTYRKDAPSRSRVCQERRCAKRSRDREGASFLECIRGDRMFAQIDRPLILTTPLGKDALLLLGFQGREAISEMFRFELQTAWEDQKNLLPFDQLLGKKVTIEMTYSANKRYINGMVSRITQGFRDDKFTYYVLEVVPELWLLGRKQDCRTFQQIAVPDILRKVLTGLDVSYQIQQTLQPREYCVQYNETDLAFVSRLMEEEGIFYFFKHSASGHQLVLADSPLAH